MTPSEYLLALQVLFEEKGRPEIAEGQMRYMRHQFEFYGLKAPLWQALAKTMFKKEGIFYGADLKTFVRLCYAADHRELHYVGTEMLQKALKKETEDLICLLEELVMTQSWWDTVDWLSKLIGMHFQRFPHLLQTTTEKWIEMDHIWLQRTAIICQRFYKEATNVPLLFDYIQRTADRSEFFIQKGAGWALRDYSKVDGAAVRNFVAENPQLSNLTKREALKWLKKQAES